METSGQQMHGANAEARREAARALGSARTPAKSEAAKRRNESRKGVPLPEETKKKMSDAAKERWAAVREQKAVQPTDAAPKEKKRMGRPPKPVDPEAEAAPKRGRGRPRKETAESTEIG